MADGFYVPIATNTLSSIDSLIANASGATKVGDAIGNLPDAYFAGKEQQYKQRNRDLFQGGVPKNPDGSINTNAMAEALLKEGGATAAPEYVALGNLQGANDVMTRNRGIDQPVQSSSGPPSSAVPAQAQVDQPQGSGAATLRQIAQARGLDVNQLSQATGINPDAPLDYNQRQQIAPVLRGDTAADEPQQQPTAAPATFGQPFAAIGNAGGGGMPAGRPVQTVPVRPNVQPPQGQPAPIQQAQAQPAQVAPGTRPPALPAQVQQMEQRAQQLENLARQKTELSVAAGRYGNAGEQKALTDEADRLSKAALSVRESMQRMTEPTPEEKNANNPAVLGFERNKKIQELDLTRADKVYGGIQAQASQYERDLKPYTDLGTAVLSDPRTYTGIGANAVLDFNKVKAIFGAPQAAMMQEAVQKLTAASVLSQINTQKDQMAEAGSNSSRLFSSQVDQVEKASANMTNTIFGNRFLSNVQQHMGEASSEIARQARDYKKTHGSLDVGFDDQVSKYLEKHPIFSDLERAHPDVLGAPTLPPGAAKWSPPEYVAWGKSLGLRPGDSVRISNGRYGTIPRLGAQ